MHPSMPAFDPNSVFCAAELRCYGVQRTSRFAVIPAQDAHLVLHLGDCHAFLREVPPAQRRRFPCPAAEAWRKAALNRWRTICPSCFDAEAERAGVRYQFEDVGAMSWSDMLEPARRYDGKRR